MNPRLLICAAIALALIPLGLAWRLGPLHLPPFLYKYGGSVFWAAMVYWLLTALLPRLQPARLAGLAAVIAALVECSRLFHSSALDAFRLNPGWQTAPRPVLLDEGYPRLWGRYSGLRGGR
jgi:hypothetical protein